MHRQGVREEHERHHDEAGDERVPPIAPPCAVMPQLQPDQEERDAEGDECDEEAKRMQRIVKGGMPVGDIVFGEKAIVHYPCSSEEEERGTGNQPPPTDRVAHRLRETDGEEHDQKTRDHQIAIQQPGVLPHAEIADHLIEGRVARTQEAIKGDHE